MLVPPSELALPDSRVSPDSVAGMAALHIRGVFLPDEEERDAWVVDGRLTFTRPAVRRETVRGRAG